MKTLNEFLLQSTLADLSVPKIVIGVCNVECAFANINSSEFLDYKTVTYHIILAHPSITFSS